MATTKQQFERLARAAKRKGAPVETVTKGLKPSLIPIVEAEYNRFKPRKS